MSKPIPIELDGISYPSLSAAAQARGVSVQAIWNRLHPETNRRNVRAYKRRKRTPREQRSYIHLTKADRQLISALWQRYPQCASAEDLIRFALARLDALK